MSLLDSGIQTDVIQSLEKRIPNHFLVIALIKQLCSFYIEDEDKCTETFNGTVTYISCLLEKT